MELTSYEQEMLSGKYGKGPQLAMEIIVQMGTLYGANRLLPITKAHIDTAAYTTICDCGVDFVRYFAEQGAKVAVPTTVNPLSHDRHIWKELGCTEDVARKSKEVELAYKKLGVIQTWTCAPYQSANIPRFGEVVSWSESNAVNYLNSVLGAKTERLPDMFDVCCAVAGRVPEYGLYLTENRRGDVLFRLKDFGEDRFNDAVDFALLGCYIGQKVGTDIPVIQGLPTHTTSDDLKTLSAALAAGGSVALFHAVGLTPEASTLEQAFQGWTGYHVYEITPQDLRNLKETLDDAESTRADLVLMGCPHCSVNEMLAVSDLLKGRSVHENVSFWLMTSEDQYHIADESGIIVKLEAAGVKVVRDTCFMLTITGDAWKGKTVVTNSCKAAIYSSDVNSVKIHMASTADCVEAAVNGNW